MVCPYLLPPARVFRDKQDKNTGTSTSPSVSAAECPQLRGALVTQPHPMSSLTSNLKSPSIALVAAELEQSRIGEANQAELVDHESKFCLKPFSNVVVHKPKRLWRKL